MGSRPSHSTRRLQSTTPEVSGSDTQLAINPRRQAACAFGAALRSARRNHGISQMTLAAVGDFDPSYVSLLERGRRVPSFIAIVRLAEALQMSPVRLLADGVARLSGDEVIGVKTLYRLAYQPHAGRFTEAGTIYPDFEAVVSSIELENIARRAVGQPQLTHVVEYVRARCIGFTR
jgi:transcriptional regulator with XRE-family HTH domain